MADRPWARWVKFPSAREPAPPAKPMEPQTGSDGKTREGDYLRRSLGLPARPADDEDMGVTWTPWPPA